MKLDLENITSEQGKDIFLNRSNGAYSGINKNQDPQYPNQDPTIHIDGEFQLDELEGMLIYFQSLGGGEPTTEMSVEEAEGILTRPDGSKMYEKLSQGKGGRCWIEDDENVGFTMLQASALTILVKDYAGDRAQTLRNLLDYWKEDEEENN